jgi:hypothetical protein
MRRYDIVFGILLILSIIDFALAAPLVLVQEKRHASVDVVRITKDVITVLGKRGKEDLEKLAKLADEYLKKWGDPAESSDAHASPSSAPPGPDHGSMNDAQAPAPNPNPNPASPKEFGQAHEHQVENVQAVQQPSSGSSTDSDADSSDSDDYLVSYDLPPPMRVKPVSSEEFGQTLENPVEHVQQPSSGSSTDWDSEVADGWHAFALDELPLPKLADPLTGSSSPLGYASDHESTGAHSPRPNGQVFDWDYWKNLEGPPPRMPASQKEFGQANENQVVHVQQPNPRPSNPGPSDPGPSNPGPSDPGPSNSGPSNPELTDPELHLDHQLLSTDSDSQPMDHLQAAIYAAKGKAKELRRIPGTARDVGNADQRELQPAERSLDPGE